MASHLIEVLLQGVWSSLTGGWFFDPHLSIFINTVHMYTWFFLFLFPFSLYLIFPSNFITWSIYSLVILAAFTTIKLINYHLNKMFDKNKIIVNEKLVRIPKLKLKSNKRRKRKKHHHNQQSLSRTTNTTAIAAAASTGQQSTSINMHRSNLPSSRRDSNAANSSNISKTYDVISIDDNYESASQYHTHRKKTPASTAAATNLDQLFPPETVGGASSNRGSRRSGRHEPLPLLPPQMVWDSSISSLATKNAYKSGNNNENNDDEENEDDENYSNIRFDDPTSIYELVEFGAGDKKSKDSDATAACLNESNVNANTSLSLNQKDIEDNSNRSLFKISEESLHGSGSGGKNAAINKTKNDLKSSTKSAKTSKQQQQKQRKHSSSQQIEKKSSNSDQHRSLENIYLTSSIKKDASPKHANANANEELYETTNNSSKQNQQNHYEEIIRSTSKKSSRRRRHSDDDDDENDDNDDEEDDEDEDDYNEIETAAVVNSTSSSSAAAQSRLLRRAQSELNFEMFEKIIKKARSHFSNQLNVSDINENFNKEPKKTEMSLITRYKAESEIIEKKMNTKIGQKNLSISKSDSPMTTTTIQHQTNPSSDDKQDEHETKRNLSGPNLNLNASSSSKKRLGARSFHNLLSLSSSHAAATTTSLSPPATRRRSPFMVVGVPLSQHMQYRELKQFKSTLECVEYLSKMHISESTSNTTNNNRSAANNNLSLRNLNPNPATANEFNLEAIKKRLLGFDVDSTRRARDDEYERQGARPKIRSSPARKSHKSDAINDSSTTSKTKAKSKKSSSKHSSTKNSEDQKSAAKTDSTSALYSRVRSVNERAPLLDTVYVTNEKTSAATNDENDRLLLSNPPLHHRAAIRRKSSGSGSGSRPVKINDDYLDTASRDIEMKTIRFDNQLQASFKARPSSARKETASSSMQGRRSSKYRPSRGQEICLVDELESKKTPSKRTPVTTNNDSSSSNTSSSSPNNSSSSDDYADRLWRYKANQDSASATVASHSYEDEFLKRHNRHKHRQTPLTNPRLNQSQQRPKISSSSHNHRRREEEPEEDEDEDENEYDYIKNDELFDSYFVSGDRLSPTSLLDQQNHRHHHRKSSNPRSSQHYRLSTAPTTSTSTSAPSQPTRRGIILMSRDEIVPASAATKQRGSDESSSPDVALLLAPRSSSQRGVTMAEPVVANPVSSSSRSRSVDDRTYIRNYTAMRRRQLFRNRLRFTSRLRNINLRPNEPIPTGEYRFQDL